MESHTRAPQFLQRGDARLSGCIGLRGQRPRGNDTLMPGLRTPCPAVMFACRDARNEASDGGHRHRILIPMQLPVPAQVCEHAGRG